MTDATLTPLMREAILEIHAANAVHQRIHANTLKALERRGMIRWLRFVGEGDPPRTVVMPVLTDVGIRGAFGDEDA